MDKFEELDEKAPLSSYEDATLTEDSPISESRRKFMGGVGAAPLAV